jgi:hypothetical protein
MEVAVEVGSGNDVGRTAVSMGRLVVIGIRVGVGVEQELSKTISKIQSTKR